MRRSRPDVTHLTTSPNRGCPFHPLGGRRDPTLSVVEPRPLDPRLVDDARAEEIALVARLLLAARHDEPLSQAAIDEALGVEADDGAAEGAVEDA